jgi:hypothetical protein
MRRGSAVSGTGVRPVVYRDECNCDHRGRKAGRSDQRALQLPGAAELKSLKWNYRFYRIPRHLVPFTIEALHPTTRAAVWSRTVQCAEGRVEELHVPAIAKQVGHPVVMRITYADVTVVEKVEEARGPANGQQSRAFAFLEVRHYTANGPHTENGGGQGCQESDSFGKAPPHRASLVDSEERKKSLAVAAAAKRAKSV